MVSSSCFRFSAYAVHTCPEGAERKPTPKATWRVFWKFGRGPQLVWGKESKTRRARSELATSSARPQGIGDLCVRRGTHTENRPVPINALLEVKESIPSSTAKPCPR